MALNDINFQEGEGQEFILEIDAGPLSAAQDFLTGESNGALLNEIAEPATAGNNIFIMSE